MLSTWIEKNVVLPEGLVAEPGPMKLWPYQRGVADAIGDPAYERVSFIKSARIGYTSLLTAAVGFWCSEEPCPILVLLPTESDAKDFVISDIEPVFAASPALHGVLVDSSRVGQLGRLAAGMMLFRSTILSRRFAGDSLKIVAARRQEMPVTPILTHLRKVAS
jgi:phage terminase large subunit GpA-like protein